MSIIGLPLILFKVRGGGDMGDILDLAIKEFEGKRVDADANVTVTNTTTETDLVTQTANTGKDMYIGIASFNSSIANFTTSNTVIARLFANGVNIEEFIFRATAQNEDFEYEFKTKGINVLAGQIIKITIQHSNATAANVTQNNGKLVLWEEDTGASPQIPTI